MQSRVRALICGCLAFTLSACSSYRSGSQGYQGMGEYRTAESYTQASPDREMPQAGERNSQYFPTQPFQLVWPVRQVRINRGFRPRDDVKHAGLDLGGTRGTPILAAHEGLVIYAGRDFRGYGKMIIVEYDKQWATLYAHLDSFVVKENRVVRAGDPIGTMGATGRATGVHLHFEVMRNQQPIDPLSLLTKHPAYTEDVKASKRRRARR